MIMNAQNPHPGVSPGIGHENDWVGPLFAEEYAKGYAKTTAELAAGALGRGAPAAALAGKTAAERLAIRGMNFVFNPSGGPIKGFIAGFSNQFFLGDAPVELPSVNRGFDRGVAFGQPIGAFFRPVVQTFSGGSFPP